LVCLWRLTEPILRSSTLVTSVGTIFKSRYRLVQYPLYCIGHHSDAILHLHVDLDFWRRFHGKLIQIA
jgi:hypothetical protein